jgi:hypothetical protein
MHVVQGKILPVDTVSAAVDAAPSSAASLANRISARRSAVASGAYRTPSVVKLNPSPLRKLAWVFGLR